MNLEQYDQATIEALREALDDKIRALEDVRDSTADETAWDTLTHKLEGLNAMLREVERKVLVLEARCEGGIIRIWVNDRCVLAIRSEAVTRTVYVTSYPEMVREANLALVAMRAT